MGFVGLIIFRPKEQILLDQLILELKFMGTSCQSLPTVQHTTIDGFHLVDLKATNDKKNKNGCFDLHFLNDESQLSLFVDSVNSTFRVAKYMISNKLIKLTSSYGSCNDFEVPNKRGIRIPS